MKNSKSKNLEIVFKCEHLGIQETMNIHSKALEKQIKKMNAKKEKIIIKSSGRALLDDLSEYWKLGELVVSKRNSMDDFCKFIHETFHIVNQNDDKKYLTKDSIRSIIYEKTR